MTEKKAPWKSTTKIETVEVPVSGPFTTGTIATVYTLENKMTELDRIIEELREEFKEAELNGMRKAATLCKENDADWAYDLIMDEIDDLEKDGS